ncbi:unnamed protein product [Cyprideis torosa]|uniref:Uncharacterized protein n=1 Tax=Cyprideis torosa TaxID=163714 RepID=A0A7R8X1Y5_9CRUS|nr:unnamed protein product [Cyprideis torosa]CAG0910608.1 unnamed protein product [Cyprideis torosa]
MLEFGITVIDLIRNLREIGSRESIESARFRHERELGSRSDLHRIGANARMPAKRPKKLDPGYSTGSTGSKDSPTSGGGRRIDSTGSAIYPEWFHSPARILCSNVAIQRSLIGIRVKVFVLSRILAGPWRFLLARELFPHASVTQIWDDSWLHNALLLKAEELDLKLNEPLS